MFKKLLRFFLAIVSMFAILGTSSPVVAVSPSVKTESRLDVMFNSIRDGALAGEGNLQTLLIGTNSGRVYGIWTGPIPANSDDTVPNCYSQSLLNANVHESLIYLALHDNRLTPGEASKESKVSALLSVFSDIVGPYSSWLKLRNFCQ